MMGTWLRRGSWLAVVVISRRLFVGFSPYIHSSAPPHNCFEHDKDTHEPAPARSLDTSSGGVELLLECLDGAPGTDDSLLQRAVGELAALALTLRRSRREVLPEQGVVDVS